MATLMEEPGSILVVSEKDETYTFLKTALSTYFKHIIRATSIAQAKHKLGKERIFLVFIFSPLSDGSGLSDVKAIVDQKSVPAVYVVNAEIYPDTVYRSRGRRIYVLSYPLRKGMLIQTTNFLYETQLQLYKMMKERDQLQEKLSDQMLINRAKLVLIEQKGLSENEAHHYIEKVAMDKSLTKRKAAELILSETET